MAYHDGHSHSLGPKLTLLLLTIAGLIFSFNLMLKNQYSDPFREYLLLACAIVFYVRLALCLLISVKRKISWFEGIMVGMLYGLMVYIFTVWSFAVPHKSIAIDIVGIALFITGSWVNTQSDYQRFKWKKKPENRGRLYTGGLFKYAMHINFLGDTVMFAGYALITQNVLSFIPVTGIFLNFILIQIPLLDNYLFNRYAVEFTSYASKTKKLIPYLY
ncbi:hypothetical protein SDC9_58490 [bioreactor metagenome]|uniref:Steroid 5-alpha reductase C-terminal domain-containing protein n=1 Tax=bioreactor metagenome TaxID=1076179 RepID=A0A644X8I1_9ZZZZ